MALSGMLFSPISCMHRLHYFHITFHLVRVRHFPQPSPWMWKPCCSFSETLEQSSDVEIALLCCWWPMNKYVDTREGPMGWCRSLGATVGVEATMGAQLLLPKTLMQTRSTGLKASGPHVACKVEGKSAGKPKGLWFLSGVIFDCGGLY